MDVPSADPGGRSRTRSTWMCGGRVRGVAFSLVTFSWPCKRKLPGRPGGGRKETGMSEWLPWQHQDGFRVPRFARPRNDDRKVVSVARVRTLTRPSGTLSRRERDSSVKHRERERPHPPFGHLPP